MNGIVKILFAFALLLSCIVIGLYVYKFAIPNDFNLSSNAENWSHFGGYIGGVLGPIFAFLAFGGVLLTVYFQRVQIEQMRNQSHLDELQRLIANISSGIDKILSSAPREIPGAIEGRGHSLDIFRMISAAGTAALHQNEAPQEADNLQQVIDSVRAGITLEINSITIEIHQLVWCLNEYTNAGGSKTVEEFYKKRYEVLICWIDAISLIENHERIQNYFNPRALREHLVNREEEAYGQRI